MNDDETTRQNVTINATAEDWLQPVLRGGRVVYADVYPYVEDDPDNPGQPLDPEQGRTWATMTS